MPRCVSGPLPVLIALCILLFPAPTRAAEIPVPPLLPALHGANTPDAVMAGLLGIPYRKDGGIDEEGNFVLLADPTQRFTSPGLNCSGLVLEACRFLLGTNFSIKKATRDRLNDSGPDSPLGHDWDFGWDLVCNLSEGLPRTLLLPGNAHVDPSGLDGRAARGFDLHAPETWQELPTRIRPGHLYLASINRDSNAKGYSMLHYHVVLLHRNADGDVVATQALGVGIRSYQRNLSSPEGLERFLRSFANTGSVRKMIAIIEVPLP